MRPYSDLFRNHYAYTFERRAMYNRMPRQHDVQELLRKQSKNEFLTEEEKGVVQAYEQRTRQHRMTQKKKKRK